MKTRILIAREISQKQEDFCLSLDLIPIVKPFIRIANLDIDTDEFISKTKNNQIWIFTSVNAVRAFLKYKEYIDITDKIAYVIGEKTEQELRKIDGLNIIMKDEYAVSFFQEIKKENVGKNIAYFCGDLSIEKNKNWILEFETMVLYKTEYLTRKIEEEYDAIAFFSPNAVNAFSKSGNILPKEKPVFAIGGITMAEVFLHFQNTVIIPKEKKFESVMEDVKDYFTESSQ